VVLLSRAVAGLIGSVAIASLGAPGCRASRPLSIGGEGEAGVGVGAGGDGGGAGGAGGGWPVTLTLVNAGSTDIALPQLLDQTCGFSIIVGSVDGGAPRVTSATPPDTWCDCDSCASAGRRVCDVNDPICDGPPVMLAAGGHLDVPWDGRVAVTVSPPPGSACPSACDHWENIAPGSYTLAIETLSGELTAQATLPSTSGNVLLSINGGH
jgi:hypothetical protein